MATVPLKGTLKFTGRAHAVQLLKLWAALFTPDQSDDRPDFRSVFHALIKLLDADVLPVLPNKESGFTIRDLGYWEVHRRLWASLLKDMARCLGVIHPHYLAGTNANDGNALLVVWQRDIDYLSVVVTIDNDQWKSSITWRLDKRHEPDISALQELWNKYGEPQTPAA